MWYKSSDHLQPSIQDGIFDLKTFNHPSSTSHFTSHPISFLLPFAFLTCPESPQTMLLNLLTLLFVSGSVLAQTQAEIQACSNSLIMTSYPESEVYTFSTTDSSFFEATYSYNPETCTPNIPINRLVLNDLSQFRVFACSLQQFDGSGVITSVCNLPGSPVTRSVATFSPKSI